MNEDTLSFDEIPALGEEPVTVPLTGRPAGADETLFRMDLDGKPAVVIKQRGHNEVEMLFAVRSIMLSAFDAWRIADVLLSALRTLPLDMERANTTNQAPDVPTQEASDPPLERRPPGRDTKEAPDGPPQEG